MWTRLLRCIFEEKKQQLVQAISSRASCDLSVVQWVCWRGQNVCSIHTLHFKCHYCERTAHMLFPPALQRSFACRVIWSDWSKNVFSSPFTFDQRRPRGQPQSVTGQTGLHTVVIQVKCCSHKGSIVYGWLMSLGSILNILHINIYFADISIVVFTHLTETYEWLQNKSLSFT